MLLDVTCLDFMGLAVNAGLLIVAIVALQFAQEQSREARRSNELTQQAQRDAAHREQQAAQQAIKDSQRANRPYLCVELRPGLQGIAKQDLVIRNLGRTAARDITLVAPWPDPGDEISQRLESHFAKAFDLPPGSSLRLAWHRWVSEKKRGSQPEGMPRTCEVTVNYRGDDPALVPFSESTTLDASWGDIMPAPQRGERNPNGMNTLDTLRDIDQALRTLNVHVGELRR